MTLPESFWLMGLDGPQWGQAHPLAGRHGNWFFTELRLFGLPDAGNNALSDRVLPAISAGPTAKESFFPLGHLFTGY
jgi:hypothetical protein